MKRKITFMPYTNLRRIGLTLEFVKTRYLTDINQYCTDYTLNVHVLIFGFVVYLEIARAESEEK